MKWARLQHPVVRQRMDARMDAGVPIVRLSGQAAVDRWLGDLVDR